MKFKHTVAVIDKQVCVCAEDLLQKCALPALMDSGIIYDKLILSSLISV